MQILGVVAFQQAALVVLQMREAGEHHGAERLAHRHLRLQTRGLRLDRHRRRAGCERVPALPLAGWLEPQPDVVEQPVREGKQRFRLALLELELDLADGSTGRSSGHLAQIDAQFDMRARHQLQVAHGPAKIGGEHRVQLRAQRRVGKHGARRRKRRARDGSGSAPAPAYRAPGADAAHPLLRLRLSGSGSSACRPGAAAAPPRRGATRSRACRSRRCSSFCVRVRPRRVCRIEGRRPSLRASSAPIDSLSSISALDVLSLLPSV